MKKWPSFLEAANPKIENIHRFQGIIGPSVYPVLLGGDGYTVACTTSKTHRKKNTVLYFGFKRNRAFENLRKLYGI